MPITEDMNIFIERAREQRAREFWNSSKRYQIFCNSPTTSPTTTSPTTSLPTASPTTSRTSIVSASFSQNQCQCRVWNRGFGKQCSFKPTQGSIYCSRHTIHHSGLGDITHLRPTMTTEYMGIWSGTSELIKWRN